MVINLEGKRAQRFYLACKLLSAATRMLLHGAVEIEIRAALETPNVRYTPQAVYTYSR